MICHVIAMKVAKRSLFEEDCTLNYAPIKKAKLHHQTGVDRTDTAECHSYAASDHPYRDHNANNTLFHCNYHYKEINQQLLAAHIAQRSRPQAGSEAKTAPPIATAESSYNHINLILKVAHEELKRRLR